MSADEHSVSGRVGGRGGAGEGRKLVRWVSRAMVAGGVQDGRAGGVEDGTARGALLPHRYSLPPSFVLPLSLAETRHKRVSENISSLI